MNIRSLTGFLPLADPIRDSDLRALRELVTAARADFARADFPVQTARVAIESLANLAPRSLTRSARDLASACQANAIDYASLGALDGDHPLVAEIPAALAATENIFASAHIASRDDGINLTAITNAACVIRQLADSTQDGFGNLRFAALANVPPHSPFFPAAHHDGGARAFAFATEAAPLAVDAFSHAKNLDDARAKFDISFERVCRAQSNVW